MASMRPIHLMVALTCILLHAGDASVHDYNGERFVSRGNAFVLHGGSEGIYATPAAVSASTDSFIRFEKVTFKRTKESATMSEKDGNRTVTVRAIIFEVGDRSAIGGSAFGGQRELCCTPDMAKLGSCTEGMLIYRASSRTAGHGWPRVLAASFRPGDLEAALPSETVQIARTGMYNLYFVYCDASLDGLVVEGKTIWKNSHGYLPGRMAPLMAFYGCMSLAFAILAVYWFLQYAKFWREVMPLQNCITLVITLGMLETTMWYFDFAEFDGTGVRPAGTTFWAATFSTVRRTVSRVLVLLVSMGYGVVRPTLGGITSKVTVLGAVFFLASEVLEVVENVGIVSDQSLKKKLLFILPVALLDTVFIFWIFTSLSRTLSKLQVRRMTAKLEMYRKFTNALIVAVVVSLGWIGFEIYFKSSDEYNEQWRIAWVIPALWQLISSSLLCVICIVWAPSHNSMRFANSDDGSEDFDHDHDDTRPLIRPGPLTYVDNWTYSMTPDAKIILRTHSAIYAKSTDEEEDKRE